MKKIFILLATIILCFSCNTDKKLDVKQLKSGIFAVEGDDGVTIVRNDSVQIEKYKNSTQIDSFAITWKNDSIYTLKTIHPKTAIETDIITYKIKKIDKNGYEFESTIGNSNYIQKGRIYKK